MSVSDSEQRLKPLFRPPSMVGIGKRTAVHLRQQVADLHCDCFQMGRGHTIGLHQRPQEHQSRRLVAAVTALRQVLTNDPGTSRIGYEQTHSSTRVAFQSKFKTGITLS